MTIKARIDEVHSITLECDMDPDDRLTISGSTTENMVAFHTVCQSGIVWLSRSSLPKLIDHLENLARAEAIS